MNKPCEYCGFDLPEGVDKLTRRTRSRHFASCKARLATTATQAPSVPGLVEYLLVTDRDSKVLKSSTDRYEVIRLANTIRKAGGEVTVFKSTLM